MTARRVVAKVKATRTGEEMTPSPLVDWNSESDMDREENGVEILSAAECRKLLERGRVGRVIACNCPAPPSLFLVNYGIMGGDIVLFTRRGSSLDSLADGRLVTFEIDEIDPVQESGWTVVVVGTVTTGDLGLRRRAEVMGIYPWPGGERHRVVRVRPQVIGGRRVTMGRQVFRERRTGSDRREADRAQVTGEKHPHPAGQ